MVQNGKSIPTLKPWLAIVGPTCSGKTWFARELLRRFPLELVNLDSFQVYTHFEVGTGRADLDVEGAHLYGFVDPRAGLTPLRYGELARDTVNQIALRGRSPLFEGGSISFLTELLKSHPICLFGIRPLNPEDVEQRIRRRLTSHPFDVLETEVRQALALGYRDTAVLSDDVVYLPMLDYVDGKADLSTTVERMRTNLAERQRTQMKAYEAFDIQWFGSSHDTLPSLVAAVEKVLRG